LGWKRDAILALGIARTVKGFAEEFRTEHLATESQRHRDFQIADWAWLGTRRAFRACEEIWKRCKLQRFVEIVRGVAGYAL